MTDEQRSESHEEVEEHSQEDLDRKVAGYQKEGPLTTTTAVGMDTERDTTEHSEEERSEESSSAQP